MPDLENLIAVTVGAAGGSALMIGALATWLGSVWKARIERTEALFDAIDTDLRQRRIEVYQPLWELTALLPRWSKNEALTYEQLALFSRQLSEWYFFRGGLYLSRSAQKDGYVALQSSIEAVLSHHRSGAVTAED